MLGWTISILILNSLVIIYLFSQNWELRKSRRYFSEKFTVERQARVEAQEEIERLIEEANRLQQQIFHERELTAKGAL